MALPAHYGRVERAAGAVLLVLLSVGCILVLKPFLSPLLWAVILVYTTWPIFMRLEIAMGDRRTLAAAAMTLGLAVALVFPLVFLASSVAENAEDLVDRIREHLNAGPNGGGPPIWLSSIPLAGEALGAYWSRLAANTGYMVETALPYLGPIRDAAVRSGITVGRGLLEVSLSVLATFFIYRDALKGLDFIHRLTSRIAGSRAVGLVQVVSSTIRGVVYGIIGTALAQGLLAALGFWLAGVPAPFLLGTLTFLLALFPVGAPLVWIPASIWLIHEGNLGWGIFMLVWGAGVVSGIDNFLRPYLISKESNLPFLLVFMGVIGGILTFGVLGIFLGPTLLAVAMALIREWVTHDPESV